MAQKRKMRMAQLHRIGGISGGVAIRQRWQNGGNRPTAAGSSARNGREAHLEAAAKKHHLASAASATAWRHLGEATSSGNLSWRHRSLQRRVRPIGSDGLAAPWALTPAVHNALSLAASPTACRSLFGENQHAAKAILENGAIRRRCGA